ncbi:MAG TPA: hypothetical protein VF912_01965 [Anaeromyxobacter sp.]
MTPPLAPAWLDYRKRLGALVAAVVGLALGAGGALSALRDLAGSDTPGNLLASAWITGSVAALGWFAAFRCPFCGERFHWTLWVANPIARACLHCGFEKWRDPHAARALARAADVSER